MPESDQPARRKGHIGLIVAASLCTGVAAALLIDFVIFAGKREHLITGGAMLGFALGWAMLALLSTLRTDQAQRWAYVPAGYMGAVGLVLILAAPSGHTIGLLGWIWPLGLLALVVWMVLGARHLRSWSRRVLLYPVCVVLALAALGGAFETVRETRASASPNPADLYDVGGHKLYLRCSGSGSPTVVLLNGFGEHSPSWAWVVQAVAPDTRVCVYDRAGEGWSQAASGPQDGVQLATDLHALLSDAGVVGPYVLAGHSVGGTYGMTYAARYPKQVEGMVLVDSSTPEQFKLPNYSSTYSMLRRVVAVFPSLARMGVARATLGRSVSGGLPTDARNQERAFASTARELRGQRDEWSKLPAAFRDAKALTDLAGKPLIVITAGRGAVAGWFAAQDKLATLSTNSVHRTVSGADHVALLDDERQSSNTSKAIRDVVLAARSGSPLH